MADPDSTAGAPEAVETAAPAPTLSEIAAQQVQQASEAASGQHEAADDTGQEARTTPAPDDGIETFYDHTNVPDDLEGTYKQMQAAYTRKTQELRDQREKVAAYDAFMSNPAESLQRMAAQYGMQLSPYQAQQMVNAAEEQQEFEPQGWDDVISKAKEEAKQEVMRELQPFLGELHGIRKQSIEQQLDTAVPEWRQYEDEFIGAIQNHPTLVSDPVKLARIALPEEVLEGRAMQQALGKLRSQQKASQVGGVSSSRNQPDDGQVPRGARNFQEAVQIATDHLRKTGKLYVASG